jgi:hypothetical protein
MTAGILLVVFAVLDVVAAAIPLPAGSHAPRSRFDVLFYVTDMALCLIGGLGLATRHRWGWAPAVVVAFGNLGFGLLAVARAGLDIAVPGAPLITLVLVVVPAVLLTAALFSRSSLAWAIGRSGK